MHECAKANLSEIQSTKLVEKPLQLIVLPKIIWVLQFWSWSSEIARPRREQDPEQDVPLQDQEPNAIPRLGPRLD